MNLTHNSFRLFVTIGMVLLTTGGLSEAPSPAVMPLARSALNQPDKTALLETYGQLPLSFEANQGQAEGQVKFLSRGSGYSLFLTSSETVLALRKPSAPQKRGQTDFESMMAETGNVQTTEQAVLRMQLVGANAAPHIVGLEGLPGKVNYFIGNDPTQWRTNVPTYAKAQYQAVYPGIDLIFYGNQRQLEYDFVIAPGADPNDIRLGFTGAEQLEIDAQGDLILYVSGEQVRMRQPVIFQEREGVREPVVGSFRRLETMGRTEIGFRVGAYDASRPLVIDPVLVYSTYLGGSDTDISNAIAVDAAGSAYITGFTASTDFPVANALQPVCVCGDQDLFVVKLSPAGDQLIYATYLGGSRRENGFDITVDASGSAYVSGWTQSADFPTRDPVQPAFGGGDVDAIIFQLDPSGSSLNYSTFVGGNGTIEYGNTIAVDTAGSAYVAGITSSSDFPTANALQPAFGGGAWDAYLVKLSPAGSSFVYSTYLGGSGADQALGIALDDAAGAILTGLTESPDFPVANALQPTLAGSQDAMVLKLDPTGAALVFSTYLGGSGADFGADVAMDAAGDLYLTGRTRSPDFPTVNPVAPALGGSQDAFVAKLDGAASALRYATYLGGSDNDDGREIAVDAAGRAHVMVITQSPDFPAINAVQPAFGGGGYDAAIAALNPTGSALVYSTYLGGSAEDRGTGLAVDAAGGVYVTGLTFSTDFPTLNALQPLHRGLRDAFVAKLVFAPGEGIAGLITQVRALVDASVLNGGQGNALIAKLEAAIQQLERGNVATAINQLESFVNQVNALISSGVLPSVEGQPLIDAANAILAALGG